MAFCEPLLLLRTSRVRRTASVQQTIGIAAAELLEEIQQRKQLWVDATLRIGEQMDRFVVSCSPSKTYHLGRRHALWLSTVLLCCSLTATAQSTSKYQVGTITEVKLHQAAGGGASDAASYDVSVKVGDTIYVVLYTPALGEDTVKYAAGRDLLVLVGKNTITYNDIVGRSFAVPIESQKTCREP